MHRRALLRSALALPAAGVVAGAVSSPAAAVTAGNTVAYNLNYPWGLDFLPDGSALVTERDNARVLRVTPSVTTTIVGTVPGVQAGGEGGLLGLALSPSYASDKRVYVYYSTASDNRVAWTTYDGGVLGTTWTPVVTGIPHGSLHNGGSLLFDPTGQLLVGCGENGNTALAQDLDSLGGKILRVSRDGAAPSDNPLVGRAGDDRIWTWGHRNPQGLALNGRKVWSAELGQETWDELNQISRGRNYGWPVAEGSDGPGGYVDPLTQWHPADCSPSGLACTRGHAWIGALRGQSLWSVALSGKNRGQQTRYFEGTFGRVRNVKVAPDGSLWITTSNGSGQDVVKRILL